MSIIDDAADDIEATLEKVNRQANEKKQEAEKQREVEKAKAETRKEVEQEQNSQS